MIWWTTTALLLMSTAAGWIFYFRLKRDFKGLMAIKSEVSFNTEYNQLISEVSVLLTERLAQAKLENEMATASAMQATLHPAESSEYQFISVSGRAMMAGACGGDWWYHCQVGEYVCVWIGDVTGHGVSSALVASACRAAVGALEHTGITDPEQAMTLLNQVLFPMVKSSIFVTAICAQIHIKTGEVKIVNASHPSIMQISGKGGLATVLDEPVNPHLGSVADHRYKAMQTKINPDDVLVLITDGLLDFPRANDPIWSQRRLLKFLQESVAGNSAATHVTAKLHEKINESGGVSKEDDVTFLAIHRKAA